MVKKLSLFVICFLAMSAIANAKEDYMIYCQIKFYHYKSSGPVIKATLKVKDYSTYKYLYILPKNKKTWDALFVEHNWWSKYVNLTEDRFNKTSSIYTKQWSYDQFDIAYKNVLSSANSLARHIQSLGKTVSIYVPKIVFIDNYNKSQVVPEMDFSQECPECPETQECPKCEEINAYTCEPYYSLYTCRNLFEEEFECPACEECPSCNETPEESYDPEMPM